MAINWNKLKNNIQREERLANYDGPDKVISSKEFLEKLKESRELEKEIKWNSGIPKLDKLIDGFETGELVIISGYTGHGKTLFGQTLTLNFAEQDIPTLWFNYEMTPKQFFQRFKNVPMFYLPAKMKENAIKWLTDRILEAKLKYNIRAVIIDHLHFLVDMMIAEHPSLEIGSIMRTLKKLALAQNVVIFLIAHTTKPKALKTPGLDSIRDSSFITQEADIVLTIYRNPIENGKGVREKTILSVVKSRRTGKMHSKVYLVFDQNKRFYEEDRFHA